MATKLQIYNMALSAARGQGTLQSLAQEHRGRVELDKWWDLVLEVTQEAAFWPCCKVRAVLEGGEELTDQRWLYKHTLPTGGGDLDLLRPWYLEDYARFDWASDGTNTVLYTNKEDICLYYAQKVTDTERFTPNMTQAVVYGLAHKIAENITGLDGLVERLIGLANNFLQRAQSTSLQQSGNDQVQQWDAPWITARTSGYGRESYFNDGELFSYPFGDSWTALPSASPRL